MGNRIQGALCSRVDDRSRVDRLGARGPNIDNAPPFGTEVFQCFLRSEQGAQDIGMKQTVKFVFIERF